jgi:hypothetical protein
MNEWTIKPATDLDDKVTVCESCLQASCWQAIFCCDNYKNADITQRSRRELMRLDREHPSYWKTDEQLANEKPAPKCVKCGHSSSLDADGSCLTLVSPSPTSHHYICGCRCEPTKP